MEAFESFIERVPVPMSGVMLGCAALGNLLLSYSETVRLVFGGISAFLLLLLLLKILMFPSDVWKEMQNPAVAGTAATFPMGCMLLSVYAKPYIGEAAGILWSCAVVLHLLLILYFTLQFAGKREIEKVFTSYFVTYVGIACAGITAPAYGMNALGNAAFWFGFVSLLVLLPVMGYRYLKHPNIPEPAQPLFCIFAAPGHLCLAAYLQSAPEKSLAMVVFLAVLSTLLYVVSFVKLFSLLRLKFYPSYAAFTFPFVISGVAMKQASAFLAASGHPVALLGYLVTFQTVVATLLVCYTLIRYLLFLLPHKEAASPAQR